MSLPSFRPSSQSGPYPGVGQGLPPKFPQRHPSLSNGGTTSNSGAAAGTAGGSNNIATGSNSLQSPPPPSSARLNPINFPFNLSSSGLPSGINSSTGNNNNNIDTNNLDPSDFPALGSAAAAAAVAAAAAATGAGTTSIGSGLGGNTNTASALLSSYASQAGTTTSNSFSLSSGGGQSGAINSNNNNNNNNTLSTQGNPSTQRAFSADDFPALGGFAAPGSGDIATSSGIHLTNGVNGLGQRLSAKENQEQASAAAALQHQQQQSQHRANLLGSMNSGSTQSRNGDADKRKQNASSSASQQPWAATPPGQFSLPLNGSGAASSPLPPNSLNYSVDNQSSLWSPSAASAQLPAAQTLLASNQQPQRPVGALSSGISNTPLPPPASVPQGSSGSATGTGQMPQTPAQQVLFSPADRFGLLGLLQIIKSSDSDLSMLALGNDLTTLGLDLGATDNLYSTFITPWSDSKAASALNIEPEFHLPSCYNVQPPPAQSKIGNFSDETLFFIFYSQPRDVMQEMAAHELYKHNWRYHKELRLWLTKEAGTEPTQKTASYERGSYIVFDPTLWERVRKEFVLEFSALESRRI